MLTGEVVVEPGARITGSHPVGPVIVGVGALVRDSRIGPFVAVGRELRAAGLADSIVLAGASINSGTGLHGSLIGDHRVRGARPWLVVGDHARIDLAG